MVFSDDGLIAGNLTERCVLQTGMLPRQVRGDLLNGLLLAAVAVLLCCSAAWAGTPEGFFVAYTHEDEQIKLIEYIPDGEKIENWTEMYTYLVVKNADASQYVSFARHFGERIERSCAGSTIRGQHLDKDGIYLIAFECPRSGVAKAGAAKDASESMVALISPYKEHILSVQYAKRSEPGVPPKTDGMFKNLFKAAHD